MLTVAKVTQSAAGGYAEYLHGRADQGVLGDYYLRDGMRVEAPGRWVQGAGSVGSDPSVAVSGEELRELMAVRRPDNAQPLRRVGGNGQAVAAIDATFSAPKSVSAVWALSPVDERLRIEAAHERAIDRAIEYAVESVPMIRERVDQQTVIHGRPAGMVATSWRHTTARAVEGRPADPQLHSHVLLHGAVRHDGRVVAIDSRSWLVHRRELGAAYRTELARELGQLGCRITRGTGRGRRYFELDGVPGALIDRWSSRRHQVQTAISLRLRDQHARLESQISAGGPDAAQAAESLKLLREYGQLAPRQERHMASLTRSAKHELLTRRDLDRAWRQTADEFGFDRVRTVTRADGYRPVAAPAGREEILARLTEFDARFQDRDARAVAFEASAGASIQDTLNRLDQLRDTGELLGLADGLETTRAHRHAERETAGLARRLAARRVKSMPSRLVADQALALDVELKARSGAGLSPAQRDALELACSDAQLTVIEGQAGTGKSTVLAGVARAHQAAGQEIIVTSTAALAAGRLSADLEAAGVNAASYSTAALHTAIDTGRLELTRETTVIHDEAALASTRELNQLLAAVEESGARLILIGDPKQSQSVGAGGLWPRIERAARENGARIELTENLRAKDPHDRNAQKLFRDGHHEQALRDYRRRGRVSFEPDQRRAEDSALEAAHVDRQAGKQSLVIAQTSNDHLDELNARAQAIRHQHRELGAESVPVPGRPYQLHAGDEVQIRRNLTHPIHGRLRNGTAGHVTQVDVYRQALVLHLDGGQRVTLEREQIDRADLRLSYVQHPFPAQGQTSDTAHLIVAEHTTQEGSYVAITRARDQTYIHARQPDHDADQPLDPVAQLADRMSRAEPEMPSIDTPLAHEHAITTNPDEPGHYAPPGDEPAIDLGSAGQTEHQRASPPQHLAVLGEQPARSHPDRQNWEAAATAIERYRTQYRIAQSDLVALGPEPPAGNFQQRHDRTHAARLVRHALERLGRHEPQTGLAGERILELPGQVTDQREYDRAPRWDP